MIRILLVDDHAVVRTGFRLLLQSHAEVVVVGEAESGEAACQRYDELTPDVLVIDIAMPGMGGLEALKRFEPITRRRASSHYPRTTTLCTLDAPSVRGRWASFPSEAPPKRFSDAVPP